MKFMNWKNDTDKKSSISIEYIFTMLLIIILIIIVNLSVFSINNSDKNIVIETSSLKTEKLNKDSIGGNHKITVINYEELSYYIKVNCTAQTVTIYTNDENGNYNIPIKAMICSTGVSTPNSGIYTISNKYEWRYLVGNVYGQYATRITGPILFHSVPYIKKDKSSLEYWEYDKLGEFASKGCVRLTVEDAKWIYDYCKPGTQVEFYNDENPGPLGKPVVMKISNYDEQLKQWDPTDPDVNNPWLNNNININNNF